jgi:uncharacterized UBP type Zn finger protein
MEVACEHLNQLDSPGRTPIKPSGKGCAECLKSGSTWVHLRLCMQCGHVGCCDSSPNKHATAHFHQSRHPVIKSFEPDEQWAYCYPHDATVEFAGLKGESPPRHYSSPAEPRSHS